MKILTFSSPPELNEQEKETLLKHLEKPINDGLVNIREWDNAIISNFSKKVFFYQNGEIRDKKNNKYSLTTDQGEKSFIEFLEKEKSVFLSTQKGSIANDTYSFSTNNIDQQKKTEGGPMSITEKFSIATVFLLMIGGVFFYEPNQSTDNIKGSILDINKSIICPSSENSRQWITKISNDQKKILKNDNKKCDLYERLWISYNVKYRNISFQEYIKEKSDNSQNQ